MGSFAHVDFVSLVAVAGVIDLARNGDIPCVATPGDLHKTKVTSFCYLVGKDLLRVIRGTNNASIISESCGNEAHVTGCLWQCPAYCQFPNALAEALAERSRQPAAEDDHFRAEQIQTTGNACRDGLGCIVDNLHRDRVVLVIQFGQHRTLNGSQVNVLPSLTNAFGCIIEQVDSATNDIAPPGNVLQGSTFAPVHNRVADLTRMQIKAMIKPAIEDQSAANARP